VCACKGKRGRAEGWREEAKPGGSRRKRSSIRRGECRSSIMLTVARSRPVLAHATDDSLFSFFLFCFRPCCPRPHRTTKAKEREKEGRRRGKKEQPGRPRTNDTYRS
jgi:hypothetical protein